jgi:hypothetical protein
MRGKRDWVFSILIVGVLGALTLLTGLPVLSQAAPEPMSPGATGLPPRPTPTAVPGAEASSSGAYIELRVPSAPAGLWTGVQWQDGGGDWRAVEGWQGTLDAVVDGEGKKVWWVAQERWGQGPFRWELRQGQDGPVLATSDPFSLPGAANQTVRVQVTKIALASGQGGGAGAESLPAAGGTRHSLVGHSIALLLVLVGLLLVLVGLLTLLDTPWRVVRARRETREESP